LLNEFGAESREDFGVGKWMTPIGLILLLWFYLANRFASSTDPEDQLDDSPPSSDTEILHVVPGDDAR
jgi:hypothetical protein